MGVQFRKKLLPYLIFFALPLLLACEVPPNQSIQLDFSGPVTFRAGGFYPIVQVVVNDQAEITLKNNNAEQKTLFFPDFYSGNYLSIHSGLNERYVAKQNQGQTQDPSQEPWLVAHRYNSQSDYSITVRNGSEPVQTFNIEHADPLTVVAYPPPGGWSPPGKLPLINLALVEGTQVKNSLTDQQLLSTLTRSSDDTDIESSWSQLQLASKENQGTIVFKIRIVPAEGTAQQSSPPVLNR